jgi:predicted ATPase/DNA-binding NarL/FixJ family response regulator
VAGEHAQAFPDGVFLADLATARDANAVARAAASVLGLRGQESQQDQALPDWLAGQLRGSHLLLILDTGEHVVDACAALADAILRGGGGPVLMVTSRQPLDLPGEVVFRIPPLAVDDGGDAVSLFADRAAAAVPGFEMTAETLPKLVRLCRLLDGIPLAIELAALRLRAIGLDELLARLPGHLGLLAGGRRTAVADRQQSLQASINWSYDLCSPAERLLWTRLSVFADGFDLAAAEEVCSGGELSTDEILDTLVGLVDKSIVLRAADAGNKARYRLLAIVREHGAGQAASADAYAARHRAHYFSMARAFAASFVGPGQLGLVTRLARDEANLRLAFDSALAAGDASMTLELATACWPWLACAGRLADASSWLARALGQDQHQTGDSERVRACAPSPALPTEDAERRAQLSLLAIHLAAWVLAAQGDVMGADELRAQLQSAATGTEDGKIIPLLTGFDGAFAALRRGAFADCAARCDELAASLPAGERWARGWAAWVKGVAGWFAGDLAAADVRLRAGLELLAPFGGELAVAQHLEAFAWLAAERGGYRQAARLQGAADERWQRLAAREGVRAPRFGLPLLHAARDRAEHRARDALTTAGYAAEHAAGAALSTEAAIRNAMPGTATPPQHRFGPAEQAPAPRQSPAEADLAPLNPGFFGPGASGGPGPRDGSAAGNRPGAGADPGDAAFEGRWELLTAREREVAALVARGLTNKDIAARLVVSKRTVDAHLEHILGKLGYSSRVQVAALASHEQAREHRTVPEDEVRGPGRGEP